MRNPAARKGFCLRLVPVLEWVPRPPLGIGAPRVAMRALRAVCIRQAFVFCHYGVRSKMHWLASKRARNTAVESVQVGKIANLPLLVGLGSKVGDVNRDRSFQRDFICLAGCDHFVNLRGSIALIMGKDDLCEMDGVLGAHATMAERALPIAEKMAVGRIMHVNVVLVWEAKFHNAQHIFAACALRELEAPDVYARPIDRVGIDGVPVHAYAKAAKALAFVLWGK